MQKETTTTNTQETETDSNAIESSFQNITILSTGASLHTILSPAKKYKVSFTPTIVTAQNIEEVERRIDNGDLFDSVVWEVEKIEELK